MRVQSLQEQAHLLAPEIRRAASEWRNVLR